VARGITENEVHDAADALVEAGERPTVERVRAHLGTGSPNTVTRYLDTWWGGLGQRLQRQRVAFALPAAPEEVALLAAQWWDAALKAALDHAQQALSDAQLAVAADRANLQANERASQATISELEASCAQALSGRRLADQRLADLQLLCDHQQAQLSDLSAQRDASVAARQRAEGELEAQVSIIRAREVEHAAERQRSAEHLRAAEDRAHAEVDRARQEAQGLRKQLDATKQASLARDDAHTALETALRDALVKAQRDAAVAEARADALALQRASASSRRPKTDPKPKSPGRAVDRAPRRKSKAPK